MRGLMVGLALVALAGCGETDTEAAYRSCRWAVNVPEWDHCIDGYIANTQRRRAEQARSNTDSDDAAALLLLGGAAFLNGYNSGRPVLTCTSIGGITTCR